MLHTLTPVLEGNIQCYLRSLPADILANIKICLEKWLDGESAYGYPHPAQVCGNLLAANGREPFLTPQQAIDLQVLKTHLVNIDG